MKIRQKCIILNFPKNKLDHATLNLYFRNLGVLTTYMCCCKSLSPTRISIIYLPTKKLNLSPNISVLSPVVCPSSLLHIILVIVSDSVYDILISQHSCLWYMCHLLLSGLCPESPDILLNTYVNLKFSGLFSFHYQL